MEARKGSVLLFLTAVLYLVGVCVQAQETPAGTSTPQNNTASLPPNANSTNNTAATTPVVPNNSSVDGNQSGPTISPNGTTISPPPASTQNGTFDNETSSTTSAPTTTTTEAPTTTTVEPTTVKDYCANISCGNGTCRNTTSTYTCTCYPGFTGDICETELVLWPDYSSIPPSALSNSTTVLSSLPFAYFNRASTELSVNIKGYASFGGDFISDHLPEGTMWPYAPDLFGIYWSDIEIPNGNSSFYFSKIERLTSNDTNSSSLIQYVKDVVNVSSFEPLYLIAATWVDVMPRPAANFSYDKATFQLILASDTQYSYAIRNYQKVWGNLGFYGRPRVSAAYTLENGSKQSLEDIQNKTGKLVTRLFTRGTPTKDPYECVQKTMDVNSTLNDSVKSLPSCPCHLSQVKVDHWFANVNVSTSCYQSVLPVRPGLKQQCCYNRFGLLSGNSSEASVPVQVNAPGVTLQEAYQTCCHAAPQLCRWFYKAFPSSDCSLYTPPYLGSSFGRTYTVTFDNNKFSFNGLGDFVLFKSGEIEVQIKTRINVGTNTTSIEAVAVKIADNTSSFQLSVQASVLVRNFTASPVTRPDNNSYYLNSSPSDFKLWLPNVIVSVTPMNDSLSCSIKVNKNDSSTQGLLGSADGNSANDLRFKNGTSLENTAGKLNISIINEFVLSWQIHNANESLFDYPSLPANDTANTTATFTPSLVPANITLALISLNESVAAEVRELCGEELFCVQEYLTSNSNMSAYAVLQQASSISDSKPKPSVNAPTFANTEKQLTILNNGSSPFTLPLVVQNGMNVTFRTESLFLNISGIQLENGTFTWNVSADLTRLRDLSYPRNLKFYATNEVNLSAEYAPAIGLCLCDQASQCRATKDLTRDSSSDGNVNIQRCDCGERAEGRFCEFLVNVCLNCYNSSACNATKLIDYCDACPSGFGGDGKYCQDINECDDKNGECQHTCTNVPGSFKCTCKDGYRAEGSKCTDINECLGDANICKDPLKVCTNLDGSYSCACLPTLVGDNKCIRAPYAHVGSVELAESGDQAWNNNLNNRESTQFKQLSGKVSRSITAKLDDSNKVNNESRFVQVLSFTPAGTEKRTKRQATAANNRAIAKFVIYLVDKNITTEEINQILRGDNATTCNGSSCQYGELTIFKYPQVDGNANLCDEPQIHRCDKSTTNCTQLESETYCNCLPGFESFQSDRYSCRDIDECAGNKTNTCPDPAQCVNEPLGSFTCPCNEGEYWDTNNKTCAADGCAVKPCKNGVCYSLRNSTNFACKCDAGWAGSYCENEDAEAYRLKVAVICVSVILGVFCLVLLIILIVICVRQHRTLENDSYTNSRYSEAEHLPRVKIVHRPGTEMSENGQGNTYARLSSGSEMSGDKNTFFGQHAPAPDSRDHAPKGVYQNRAYEEDVGERL